MSVDLCRQSLSGGVVPYLGTYLTVLMMLDTALTDTVEVSTRHSTQSHHLNDRILDCESVFKSNMGCCPLCREALLTLRSTDE